MLGTSAALEAGRQESHGEALVSHRGSYEFPLACTLWPGHSSSQCDTRAEDRPSTLCGLSLKTSLFGSRDRDRVKWFGQIALKMNYVSKSERVMSFFHIEPGSLKAVQKCRQTNQTG